MLFRSFSDNAATVSGGPTALCFGTNGRPTAVANPNIGGTTACVIPVTPYDVRLTASERKLRVQISPGGTVRMCDFDKALSSTNPDGC